MQSAGTSSGSFATTSEHFATSAGGVAALDTPQSSQTKLEIRNIVADIAEFSASQLPQSEFLNAVLPRICSAMGSTAAALWHCHVDSRCELLGHHRLPELLLPTETEPSPSDDPLPDQLTHSRILQCVIAEGSAVLVPPKSVRMTAERPTNPLEECLLVVPFKIDDRYEMLLEVIQPPSGGPAAQRGYLRFVAQMADLVSDYLRRSRLQQYSQRAAYVDHLQKCLLAVSSAADLKTRWQTTASALADLLNADLVVLARRNRMLGWKSRWQVGAISHVDTFDTRSEIVLAAERMLAAPLVPSHAAQPFTILATASLTLGADTLGQPSEAVTKAARSPEQLRTLLGCHHMALLKMGTGNACQALIALDSTADLSIMRTRAIELASTFAALLQLPRDEPLVDGASSTSRLKRAFQPRWLSRSQLERLVVRSSMALLLLAVALFPMPDNIATVAVLEPHDKELYYAPSSATVEDVSVNTHQAVKKGEPLITLVDSQLQARYDDLQGQKLTAIAQRDFAQGRLKVGVRSTEEELQLSSQIAQLDINLTSIEEQLKIVDQQRQQLTIVARRDAIVTTWDSRNQLKGRPVTAGQLLLTTHQPTAPWQLRVSIPERQLGQLRDAMAQAREGLPVQFALSSHPSQVGHGRLVKLSEQLFKDESGASKAMGIVAIEGNSLPAKSDGAVARATIACGRTYAGWLAIRDAYREASAWWRLNW